jgi:MerR family transcriptional regulator, heat shock protein HspR
MARERKTRSRSKAGYMISAVAEMYNIHPQTLRLYEREGLLLPSRSEGNTRLYSEEDLERLEVILSLTRDLGVNLAGIEIILNMRARMKEMEREVQALVEYVRHEFAERSNVAASPTEKGLIRVGHRQITRARAVRTG